VDVRRRKQRAYARSMNAAFTEVNAGAFAKHTSTILYESSGEHGGAIMSDPRSLRCGLYRIKSPPPDEHDVMVDATHGGSGGLLRETLYREQGYSPPFEELPWAEEYLGI